MRTLVRFGSLYREMVVTGCCQLDVTHMRVRMLTNLQTLAHVYTYAHVSAFFFLCEKSARAWLFSENAVIFHVATLMPNRTSDPTCTSKIKHIGNNFVQIVYNNSESEFQVGSIVKVCTTCFHLLLVCVVAHIT